MKTLRELVIDGIRSYCPIVVGRPAEVWEREFTYFWLGEYDDQRPRWQHVQTTRENAPVAYRAALESLSDEDLLGLYNDAYQAMM